MLTARENMRRTVFGGGEPDRFVNNFEAIALLFNPAMFKLGPSPQRGGEDQVSAWGITRSWPEHLPAAFPVHTPDKVVIKDIENWKEYVKAPSIKCSQEEWDNVKAQYDAVDREKAYAASFVAPGIFEQCHHLGEIVNTLMNLAIYPDEMHDLIKYLLEFELELAEGICTNLGPDALFHHDDWGSELSTFFSPDMFAEFFVEPYKELYGYYKDHGVEMVIHHADSYAATLIDYMIEIGIDVFQGCMETNDVFGLLEKYRGKMTFMGNIDNKVIDFEGWSQETAVEVAAKYIPEGLPIRSYIPCITQGGPGSLYKGAYSALVEEIDKRNVALFGGTLEEIEEARLPIAIMF